MSDFICRNKVFVKSSNSTDKINKNYLITLLVFIFYMQGINIFTKNMLDFKNILVTLILCIVISLITDKLFNIIKKNKKKVEYILDLSIACIITLFGYRTNIYITLLALIISIIVKQIFVNINLGSSIFGILIVLLYDTYITKVTTPQSILKGLGYIGTYQEIITSNGGWVNLMFMGVYLSALIAICMFIYLFIKKSIKYNIVVSYILVFSCMMLFLGLLKGMNIYYMFFQLLTGNLVFAAVYLLSDYGTSPTTGKGQIVYGTILAIITFILRFIIPELAVIVSLIIGVTLISNMVEKLSIRLEYNHKFTRFITLMLGLLTIISIGTIYFII